jgi:hypothetical protein
MVGKIIAVGLSGAFVIGYILALVNPKNKPEDTQLLAIMGGVIILVAIIVVAH